MKPVQAIDDADLLSSNNVKAAKSAASVDTSQVTSVQEDPALLNLSSADYTKLSKLVGYANKQNISVDEFLQLYPQYEIDKAALNAIMQQQLNNARMNEMSASTVEISRLSKDKRAKLSNIAAQLTALGPDATEQQIRDSGVYELLKKLSPLEQHALYGLLTASTEKGARADLNPTVSADQPTAESPSSALLQTADDDYKKNDYDGAFHAYQDALKADPTLSASWPTIYYQLGVCSEYAKDAALNNGANGFYQQYLHSPNPDPKIAPWVQKESQWLTDKPQAEGLVQAASDQLYKENDAAEAFSKLKDAIAQFPELANRQPDVYYNMAMYAFSADDLSEAKKYLELAQTAMQEQLKQDPNSKYAQYYMGQISDLMSQVQDPNLSTSIANYLGDKLGARGFWKELLNGLSQAWMGKGDRIGTHGTPDRSSENSWKSKTDGAGLEKISEDDIGRRLSNAEKKELRHFAEDVHHAQQEEIAKKIDLDKKQQQVDKSLPERLEMSKAQLEQAQKDYQKAAEQLVEAQNSQTGFVAAAKHGEVASATYAAEAWKKTVTNDTEQLKALTEELAAAYKSSKPTSAEIYALKNKLTDAEKNLETSQKNATAAQEQITKAAASATDELPDTVKEALNELRNNYGTAAKNTADLIKAHDVLVDELTKAKASNEPTADIDAKLKANADALQKSIVAGKAAQNVYTDEAAKVNKAIAEHETTYPATKEGTHSVTTKVLTPEGHETTTQSVSEQGDISKTTNTSETTTNSRGKEVTRTSNVREGKIGGVRASVRTGTNNDPNANGPGWWGLGNTLDHQQAAAFQWHLSTGADGKISSDWRGPFTTTSKDDPTQDGVSVASGGSGSSEYNLNANGGVNILNVEHRDYDMVYGGTTGSGTGVGGMLGTQARADLVDEQFGLNYSGGEASIGGEKIKNLVTASVTEAAAVGAQADADVSAAAGRQPDGSLAANLGVGAGAFAGEQVSGMAAASVDGVGANVMGQAWAGVGAKFNADASLNHGKLSLDLELGAALGVGGCVSLNVTIDFNEIGQELKGIGTEGVDLAEKWGDAVPGLGHAAGFIAGVAVGLGKFALSTVDAIGTLGATAGGIIDAPRKFLDNFASNTLHMGRTGEALVDAAALVTGITPVTDLLSIGPTIKDAWNKPIGETLDKAKDDAAHGHIVSAAVETVVGGIVYVADKIEDGIKAVFSGW